MRVVLIDSGLLSYFELLLRDTAVVWVEEPQHVGDQISAAEVVGSQRSEQHILSSAAYLKKEH